MANFTKALPQELPQSGGTNPEVVDVLPVRTRPDLEVAQIGFNGRYSYVIKDPIGLKYQRLQPIQYRLLELLESPRNLPEIQEELHRFDPTWHLEIRDIQQLISDYHDKGLVMSVRPGQGHQLYKKKQKKLRGDIFSTLTNILFLRLPGWPPGNVLKQLDLLQRFLLHPLIVAGMIMVIGSALVLVAREAEIFQHKLPAFNQFFSWQNLPYLWASIIVAKIVHEFGHAMACRHFGADVHQIGVMILMLTPTLYCDVTDSWMLKNKWKRIAIGLCGPFFESVLASMALFVWWWTNPGIVHFVCLNLFIMSTVTNTIFNLNPLVKFDGYYILSDYLEIPNLKQQSDRAMTAFFCDYALGVRLPRDPYLPESDNPWLITYCMAAWLYRWLIMSGITVFMYVMLKPYGLQNFAFAILAMTLGMMIYGIYRGMKQALQQIQPEKPHPIRLALLGVFATSFLLAACLIPIPWWVTCSFEVEPHNVAYLYALVPGKLTEVMVKPEQKVQAGDILCRFENEEFMDELQKLEQEVEVLQITLTTVQLQRDDVEIAVNHDKLQTAQTRIRKLKEKIDQLTIHAPIAGIIIPPQNQPERVADPLEKLPRWHGTPFDASNVQAWFEKSTPLMSIAPDANMQAVLMIDQDDRNDIHPDQKVTLQCVHIPGIYLESKIGSIGERETDEAPMSLTQKSGGNLATVTDKQGRETLISTAYRAIVPLPNDQKLPLELTGSRGEARVIISNRSLAGWCWRMISQTFTFRL
jgi:putative peptide zinc metalloprotease protein